MVIALLGLIAYLVADFHIQQLNLRAAERRAEGVVRDVHSIIDASLAWAAADEHGRWPHGSDDRIDIKQLENDGFFVRLPENRYYDCPSGCDPYALTGWDRDERTDRPAYMHATDANDKDPDDLIVNFTLRGIQAHSIAAQLPQGSASLLAGTTDVYEVEARLLKQGGGRFVLLRNEGRPLIFARVESSVGGTVGTVGGSLHNVDRITQGFNPLGPGIAFREGRVEVTGGPLQVSDIYCSGATSVSLCATSTPTPTP